MVQIIPKIDLFRLVAPSFSSWSGGAAFLVRGEWFPSRLPLEGTAHIQNFGSSPVTYGTPGALPRQ
jgi:hypothetical protein